jgi:hypothetical protein
MSLTRPRNASDPRPRRLPLLEIVGFALVAAIAADELLRRGDAHLWIGIVMGLSAVAGAVGYLLQKKDGRLS